MTAVRRGVDHGDRIVPEQAHVQLRTGRRGTRPTPARGAGVQPQGQCRDRRPARPIGIGAARLPCQRDRAPDRSPVLTRHDGTNRSSMRCDGRGRGEPVRATIRASCTARSANERSASLGREALAYADTLFNLARYLTGNSADAEDLVQETYARALRGAAQFEPGTNLKAWLFRILRNTWLSLARRRRIDPIVGGLDTVSLRPPSRRPWRLACAPDDAELDRLRKVVAEDIERALMRLSDDARTVVLLDLEGLTEGEVAAVLGCAVGTVKSRLARARQALRRLLQDYAR